VDHWLAGRDKELTCVCSRASVSIGQGDSYPVAESHANVLYEADLKRSIAQRQIGAANNDMFICAVLVPVKI
jgi:hypothetical protein